MTRFQIVRLICRRRGNRAVWIFAVACAVCAGFADAGEATPPAGLLDAEASASGEEEIAKLIPLLGSDDYRVREAATQALIDLGPRVTPHVEHAAESSHLEVRTRAERILAIVARQSFEQNIEAFIAGVSGEDGASLPGWDRARPRLGDGQDVRRLYAQMYRAEPSLFAAYGPDDSAAAAAFSMRVEELHDALQGRSRIHYRLRNRLQQANSTNVMALLFVGADRQLELSPNNLAKFRAIFIQSWPPARVQAAAEREFLREWLAAWIVHRFGRNQREYEGIMLGMQYDVPETLDLALEVLGRRGSHHSLMYAALCVGKYGEDWHLPRLESLLANETVVAEPHHRVNNRMVRYETQLRDMALYVLLSRTGQDPEAYGFDKLNANADYLYLSHSVAFDGQESRQKAFAMWQAWRDQNVLFEGEPPSPLMAVDAAANGESPALD